MQENGKRLLSLLVVVAMVFSMMPVSVGAQEQVEEETLPVETLQPEESQPEKPQPEETKPQEGILPPTKNQTGEEYPALELGVTAYVTFPENDEYVKIFAFTPEESDLYYFTGSSDVYTETGLYDTANEDGFPLLSTTGTDFFFEVKLEAGHTYQYVVDSYGADCNFQVTAIRTPLESLSFEPITIMPNTCGWIQYSWDEETQQEHAYYHYPLWDLLKEKTSYTATFTGGEVLTGNAESFVYDGREYEVCFDAEQSYANPWLPGNTYDITVEIMGRTTEVPVNIMPSPLTSFSFESVTIVEGSCGAVINDYNPETEQYDLEYFYYQPASVLSETTYTANFTDGTVQENSGGVGLEYEGQWYPLETGTAQNYENQWTVGNTYYIDVFFLGQYAQVPVTIIENPVESVSVNPVTVEEETNGSWYTDEDGDYYYYEWWNKLSYTLTFTDGTEVSGTYNQPVEYGGRTYGVDIHTYTQSGATPWLAGGTYTEKVQIAGQLLDVNVTIKAIELIQLELDVPATVTISEYGRGYADLVFNPEVSGAYEFTSISDLDTYCDLYEVVEGGTQDIASNDNDGDANNFRIMEVLEAGHTYRLQVRTTNWEACSFQVKVTRGPLESITFQPITVLEGTCGGTARQWIEETQTEGRFYFQYATWDLLYKTSYTATFRDGTVITGNDGGFTYKDQWYDLYLDTDQSYDNQWVAGNTYTLTVKVLGVQAEIPVTIVDVPVESLTIAPINVVVGTYGEESADWNPETEDYDLEYFRYNISSILTKAKYAITYAGQTEQSGTGSSVEYDNAWYSFYADTDQSYYNQWTVGNTYTVDVFLFGEHIQVPVSIIENPIESVSVAPITLLEKTNGSWIVDEDGEYFQYYWWNKLSHTVTFTDGTELSGTYDQPVEYDGETYAINWSQDTQSAQTPWVAGNTYETTVTVSGTEYAASVTVEEKKILQLELDVPLDVKIWAGEEASAEVLFTPEVSGAYVFTSISERNTYAHLFEVVEEGTISMAESGGDPGSNNFLIMAYLEAGHNYKLVITEESGTECSFQVKVTTGPLESITFQPITIMANTYGNIMLDGNDQPYYAYYPEWMRDLISFTATFKDGTVITGSGNDTGFVYNNTWYELSFWDDSQMESHWMPGNTYAIQAEVMGVRGQIPVTIQESPLQNITIQPVTIVEGTCGNISYDYNPDTEENDLEYFQYDTNSILARTRFTATRADGSTVSGYANESIYYNDQWYGFTSYAHQNYNNQWTAGNPYTIDVFILGQHVQVPVTIVESPVVSVTANPVTMYESIGGDWNSHYLEDGSEDRYYTYYWWNKVTYTVTYADGTTATVLNGSGIDYNDQYYSMIYSDLQSYEDQWTVGNRYTGNIIVMGVSAEVSVTIEASPVESVTFDPIVLEEYTNGYFGWDENGEYFRYNWIHNVSYSVTFRDGTVQQGTYWNAVHYEGNDYGITTYEDPQNGESPWLPNNTYSVKVQFEGVWYDVYVTIAKTAEDNGFTYIVQDGQAIINGCTLQSELLQIPEAIDGRPVVGVISLGDALDYALEVRVPDSVTMLGVDAFNGNWNNIPMKKLVLGKGVTSLKADMLCFAKDLEQIEVAAGNPALCSIDGVVYNKAVTKLLVYPAGRQELHKIPDSVTDVSVLFSEEISYGKINVQFGAGVKNYKLVDGIIYNEDMTQVIKVTSAATGSYTMPESVMDIAPFAFTGSSLTSVTVSPSVTYISYQAFYEAIHMEEITIPTSVTAIGSFEESGCVGLKKVHISDISAWCNVDGGGGLLYYAHDLYLNGEKIVDLVIPETVSGDVDNIDSIASGAFAYGSFASVTIPSGISYIGWDAFKGCENLEKVNISDLSAWCSIAFDNEWANPLGCARDLYLNGNKVTDLVLPKTVTGNVYVGGLVYGVGDYAFYNANIEKLTVPSYVYRIGTQAFGASDVETIVIEEGVSKIWPAAFENTAVKSVDLPDSLVYLGENSFDSCKALTEVTFGSGLTIIEDYAFRNTSLTSVILPEQIRRVGMAAFKGSALTEVNFLCQQVEIGWQAFKNCPLGDLKLGDNITNIEEEGFCNIIATNIDHPSTVTELAYGVYAHNQNLVSVTIPDSVTYIDFAAFRDDINLSHVLYTGTQAQWEALDVWDDVLNGATIHYEATGNEVTTEQDCTTIRLFCTICNAWETVEKRNASHNFQGDVCVDCGYAYGDQDTSWRCEDNGETVTITRYLGTDTDVTVPAMIGGKTVAAFTADVFAYDRKLTSVILPDSITEIPAGAFANCSALRSVTLGKNVKVIGNKAFLNDYSLSRVDLPDGLATIGESVFYNCYDLTVSIPESVQTIGALAFYGCNSLERVDIPAGVTEIAYEMFSACWDLAEVTIPNTVVAIGYYAFSGTRIEELTIPASVQTIQAGAFHHGELKTAVFLGDMPQMEDAFHTRGLSMFFVASNKTWQNHPSDDNTWYACEVPVITKQPENRIAQQGEKMTLSASAYGQRLRYQWYYAAADAMEFVPVGGNSMELTVTADQTTNGARAYCVVTDIVGQTTKTNTVTLSTAKVTGIRLNQLPYTLEYDLRQELRTRGLEVMLVYDNGTEVETTDYTVTGYNASQSGTQTLTVTCRGYTATFDVKVNGEKVNFTDTQQKIEISAPDGAIEHDVELVVEQVAPEAALPEIPEIPEVLQENEAVIFDITLEKEGQAVQPTETVQVSIPVPEHMESKRCKVYYVADDGTVTDMNAVYVDGRMVFNTNHFSLYAVVEVSGKTVSGKVIGDSDLTGTVVQLLSSGEVLESVTLSANSTYAFADVVDNSYVIRVVQNGVEVKSVDITVAHEDLYQEISLIETQIVTGDLDGNGLVDEDDAIYLLRYALFGEENFPVNQSVDYDKSGKADQKDAIYLLRHVLLGDSMFPLQ